MNALIFVIALIMASCSDSPSPYQKETPPQTANKLELSNLAVPALATRPDGGKVEGRVDNLGNEEKSLLKRDVSSEPIILGRGIAGITFETTLQDARNILSEEQQIVEIDPFEMHLYPEGIAIQWDKLGTQKPEIILVTPQYLGPLMLPAKYADEKVGMGSSFAKFFTAEDPQGLLFFNDVFKLTQGLDPESEVDCFLSGQCQVLPRPDERSILYMIGNSTAIMLSDDERKALSMILMTSDAPLLNFRDPNTLPPSTQLTTQFDLVTGKLWDSEVLVPVKILRPDGLELTTEQPISLFLGERFDSVPAVLLPEDLPAPKASMETFQFAYRGGALSFSRSNFDRQYKMPNSEEVLRSIVITPAGQDTADIELQLAGKYFVMRETGAVETKKPRPLYKLKPNEGMPLPLGTKFDSPGFDRDRKVKATFVQSMAEAVSEVMRAELSNQENIVWLPPTSSGIYGNEPTTEYFGQSGYVDLENMQGRIFEVFTTYNTTTVIYGLSDVTNQIELESMVARSQPVTIGNQMLAGFSLGQVIKLQDIDRAADQATLNVNGVSKRVEYKPTLTIKTVELNGAKVLEKNLKIDQVSFGGVTLGLVNESGNAFRIASLSASGFFNEILSLCDLSQFSSDVDVDLKAQEPDQAQEQMFRISFGMSEEHFFAELHKQEAKGCRYYAPSSPDAILKNEVYYFPSKRVRVDFSSRQLSSITIY